MRGFVLITGGAAALMGCSAERRSADTGTANINAAAVAAQGDIDTYAASTLQATPPASSPPSPKAAPVAPPVEKVERKPDPQPSSEPAVVPSRPAVIRQVASGDATETYRCGGQTRVSARADDSEFERPPRDAPAEQRPAGAVWQKGEGQDVRAGRDTLAGAVPAGCTAN